MLVLLKLPEVANSMNYKNTRTGVVITTPCVVSGGNWKLIDEEQEQVNDTPVSVVITPTEETEQEDAANAASDYLADVTKKDIMQELDAMKIKYDPRAKKQELYDLMMQGE